MKGLIAGALASLMAAGAWADINITNETFSRDSPVNYHYTADVYNGSEAAIASIRYRFVTTTLGRELPWVERNYKRDILGGIEPGETYEMRGNSPDQLVLADDYDVEIKITL